MSTKGQSVVAARRMVDELCNGDVPVLVLHDFDKQGFEIAQTLTSISQAAIDGDRVRYDFKHEINVIDLGLRLEDVKKWNLKSEYVKFNGGFGEDSITTEEEREFLRGNRRVELNAFTSDDFIEWIESKLQEYGIKKVIPSERDLSHAYERAFQIAFINQKVGEMEGEAIDAAREAGVPDDLLARIAERIESDQSLSWDKALAEIAKNNLCDDTD